MLWHRTRFLFRLEERLNFRKYYLCAQKIIIKAGNNMFHDLNDVARKQQGGNLYRGGVVFIPVVNGHKTLKIGIKARKIRII